MERREVTGAEARDAYRATRACGCVETANPAALAVALLDELLDRLDAAAGAVVRGQRARALVEGGRVTALLTALTAGLDARGGMLTARLSDAYAAAGQLAMAGVREYDPDRIERARALIAPIADAYATL